MNYYIGIDLGTSSCKGILLNRNGAVLADHSVNYPVSTPYTNWSEQDPADWYKATVEILKVLSEGREESVRGVGIAGQMHGLVMLDEHDEVIRPAILWNDGRSAPQTAYLNSLGTLPTLTGNIAFPGFTAPKILWVKENEPENFAKAKKICLPKDYLAYKLTGVFSSEYSDAAGMLLLDVQNKCWSPEMCEICGITVDMLPTLFESYEATGKLKAEYSLPNAILCAGAGDNAGRLWVPTPSATGIAVFPSAPAAPSFCPATSSTPSAVPPSTTSLTLTENSTSWAVSSLPLPATSGGYAIFWTPTTATPPNPTTVRPACISCPT